MSTRSKAVSKINVNSLKGSLQNTCNLFFNVQLDLDSPEEKSIWSPRLGGGRMVTGLFLPLLVQTIVLSIIIIIGRQATYFV